MPGSNGSATAVALPSNLVSHAFEPREEAVVLVPHLGYTPSREAAINALESIESMVVLPPNSYLCRHCRLAEAAHLETLSGEQR